MMCDFNKIFRTTDEEMQKHIEHIQKELTLDKCCCVCANAEKRADTEMGYAFEATWCKITGEYRDTMRGNSCQNWKAKYPEYEEKMNERLDRE